MINKRIVINNGDGSVSIVTPAPEMFDPDSRTRKALLESGKVFNTDEEVLDFIINKDVPKNKEFRIVDLDKLPSDRCFRNAWTDDFDTNTVDVDVNKAKEIKRNEFRDLRKPLLEALDVEFMKALEANDTAAIAKIKNQKQLLRDVTRNALPNEIEKLKDFVPAILKK